MDPDLKMYFLLTMGMFQPAMLVYQRVHTTSYKHLRYLYECTSVPLKDFLRTNTKDQERDNQRSMVDTSKHGIIVC